MFDLKLFFTYFILENVLSHRYIVKKNDARVLTLGKSAFGKNL